MLSWDIALDRVETAPDWLDPALHVALGVVILLFWRHIVAHYD